MHLGSEGEGCVTKCDIFVDTVERLNYSPASSSECCRTGRCHSLRVYWSPAEIERPWGGAGVGAPAKEPADATNAFHAVCHLSGYRSTSSNISVIISIRRKAAITHPHLTPLCRAASHGATRHRSPILRGVGASPRIAWMASRSSPLFLGDDKP